MKILSWNILEDSAIDFKDTQRDYPTIHTNQLKANTRIKKIIQILEYSRADVILLQEVSLPWTRKLKSKLVEYRSLGLCKHNQSIWPKDYKIKAYGNLTLIRKSVIEDITHKCITITDLGTAFDVTGVQFKHWNFPVCFINSHFDSAEHKNRMTEAEAMLHFAEAWETNNKEKVAIILAGDFNTDAKDLHKLFNESGFQSAIDKDAIKIKSTFLCEKPMIDYIYVKGLQVTKSGIWNEPVKTGRIKCFQETLKRGSDHYPVWAEME